MVMEQNFGVKFARLYHVIVKFFKLMHVKSWHTEGPYYLARSACDPCHCCAAGKCLSHDV
jgi:hypothetical protein